MTIHRQLQEQFLFLITFHSPNILDNLHFNGYLIRIQLGDHSRVGFEVKKQTEELAHAGFLLRDPSRPSPVMNGSGRSH